jgi:hypothetical protein
MKRRMPKAFGLGLPAVLVAALSLASQGPGLGLPGVLRVGGTLPEFPSQSGAWLWSAQAQRVKDPDGRFGILFAWRQGHLEARHSLVWLADLARRRPELRILSMHAPRYDWERDLGRLGALQAYEDLSVPVLWDVHRAYWRVAGFKNYPTVVLFDPNGKILWFHEGEMKAQARPGERLEMAYEAALEDYLRKLLNGPEIMPNSGGVVAAPAD